MTAQQALFASGPAAPVAPAQAGVEGVVEGITYASEESGYRVLRVRLGDRTLQTWAGVMPVAQIGQTVRAVGKVERHPKYGEQFKVESMTPTIPSTVDGLERYLASGVLPGVKAATAKKIVAKFGEQTIEILDKAPERLKEVKGISKKRIEELKTAWGEQRAVTEVMVFLQQHGASGALAKRIHRRYGNRAVDIVSSAPYRLAIEVHGIGFQIADRIARSVGIGADSPERAQAGVLHQLGESAGQGHVYADRDELAHATARMLEVDVGAAYEAIRVLAGTGRVLDEGGCVYDERLHAAEVRLAGRLRELLDWPEAAEAQDLSGHVDDAIAGFERDRGMQLAPAQRDAVALAARAKVLVITGGPGCGKTTLLKALLSLFDLAKLDVAMGSPTGRAAKRMSETTGRHATTLHRLLAWDPREKVFARNADNPIEADVVVVDEASMLDCELADHLCDAVADGARLMLVGDVDQLPSVGPGAVLRDIIESGTVPTVRLTQIFRQAGGSSIVENAHRINHGEMPVGDASSEGQFFFIERTEPESAAATILDTVVARLPQRFGLNPIRDIQVMAPMYKGEAGVTALNTALQRALNPSGPEVRRGGMAFRIGDKVMQLRNDYDREVWNGDVGYVVDVEPEDGALTVEIDGRKVEYESDDLDHLTLAYACSVHKLQGSEAPAVVVVLQTAHHVMLSRNLLYTAVTRGKRLVVLVADPKAVKTALRETRRGVRRTRLTERLQGRS
ncbi:SF1B family DNA helicase RecD2 [Sorangium sp. So ce233]|uniref:SF1B family DNA helicase RecD2 n=1 Tax=Sorangium sp. So ce233 TaxID=3133290 RepID=UPI003F62D895